MKATIFSNITLYSINCRDLLSRNKAKNALSLATPIFPEMAAQK
jgi:hypothetical protein